MYDPNNIYKGRYKEFIEGIMRERPLNEIQECNECHHVIPICCEGKDNDIDNILINLNCKEHFISHKILAEENSNNTSLVHTYWMMSNFRKGCTPEEYEEARLMHKKIMSEKFKSDNPIKYCVTEEYRKKMSESTSGERNGFYGKKHTEETKKKMSDIKKSSYIGEGNPFYGKKHSKESRDKMSISHRKPRGPRGKKLSYNLVCKSCNNSFIGSSPSQKFCETCKSN